MIIRIIYDIRSRVRAVGGRPPLTLNHARKGISMDIIQTLARELGESAQHVENVVRLLDEGNTIPFIAR